MHDEHVPHGRLSSLGLAVAAVASLAGGCMADSGDGGILITKNVAAGEDCKPTASETEPFISRGRLELLLAPRSGYLFIAQMKSRITALAGQEDQRTIITSGARVDIEFPNSTLFNDAELEQMRMQGLTRFKQLFSAAIKPGGITDAGFDVLPAALAERVATKVDLTQPVRVEAVVTFTVEGSMSGANVESQAFSYPITLGTFQTVNVAGTCPLPSNFGEVRKGNACNPLQDGVIDCCVQGDLLRCPAVVGTAVAGPG